MANAMESADLTLLPRATGDLSAPAATIMLGPPLFVPPSATVADAARLMHKAGRSSVLVEGEPPGIITDRDFRSRVLASDLGPETPVRQVMSKPLKTQPADTPIYGVLLFMLAENIHHVPLTQGEQIVGIVTDTDLLRYQAKTPLYFLRRLEQVSELESLSGYAGDVADMVCTLFEHGLDATEIGRVVSSLNDTLVRRLLHLTEAELGAPPTPYAWIVFGSEGRMEQALLTDQDNALVYERAAPDIDEYFDALAQRMVQGLILAGFPPCKGGYMATNWHRPIDEWIELFRGWIETPEPQALLESSIFFDFRAVYGDLSLSALDDLLLRAGGKNVFLGQMARANLAFRPPLGFFRHIKHVDGMVDVKAGGIAPIVGLARLYALEANVLARSTLERLDAAANAGVLSAAGAAGLTDAFRLLLQMRLQGQLDAIRQGKSPDNRISLSRLSKSQKAGLRRAFLTIRDMQDAMAMRYQTDLLG